MAKKSKAQLKRLRERAAARGETYIPPEDDGDEGNDASPSKDAATTSDKKERKDAVGGNSQQDQAKRKAAIQLKKELAEIESNEGMKAKERRSAKRKAEAIAVETSGCASADELLKWHEANGGSDKQDKKRQKEEQANNENKRSNPYIVFVGQLSYDTTKERLFRHFQKQLQDDNHHAAVTEENVKIRLLTDPKTKKSRGMAFVEVRDDPELLYSCLKLHHTHLDGRRINVERSAGGGKSSESRRAKLQQFREEQIKHMEETVDAVLEEYYKRGEIKEKGELDEGVILLCKRHSAAVVQAALERYVESNGRDMDNPSAYLTFLLGKLAEEGIYNDLEREKGKGAKASTRTKRKEGGGKTPSHAHESKRPKKSKNSSKSNFANSEFAKQGIDMEAAQGAGSDPQSIFPSLARRGRGRGYM